LKVVAVVCLILLALLTVAQAMHVHACESDADHCNLCVAMHSVFPIAILLVVVVLIRIESKPANPEVRVITRFWHAALFTRPPPAGC
jgi:hypothetical protein